MKFLLFLSWIFGIFCVSAQEAEQLRVDQIKIESENALMQSSMPKVKTVIEKAFRSKDVDVVSACFNILGNHIGFSDMLESAEPLEFKNQLVLAILRQPWKGDLDSQGLPPSGSYGPPTIHYICIEQIKPYLPEENLDANSNAVIFRFDDPKERKRLANLFEAALKKSEKAPSEVNDMPSAIDQNKSISKVWWAGAIGLLLILAILGKFLGRKIGEDHQNQ